MAGPLQSTVQDICTNYRLQVCQTIFNIVGEGKKLRLRLNGLGITTSTSPVAAGQNIGAITFPLEGDLSYITTPEQLIAMLLALEILETALGTPSNGIVPVAAFSYFAG